MRKYIFIIFGLISANNAFSQQFEIDKHALMISGSMNLNVKRGDLYEDVDGASTTIFQFNSTVDFFFEKGFFGGISYGYGSQRNGVNSLKEFGIGPNLGFALGNENSKIYPYVITGLIFSKISVEQDYTVTDYPGKTYLTGYAYFGGVGVMFPFYKHVAITLEADYAQRHLSEFQDSYKSKTFGVSIGIVCYLY